MLALPFVRMWKKPLLAGIVPMIVMILIAAALQAGGKSSDARSTFMVGLIVGAVAVANVVYDLDHWSVAKKIGIHFLLMLVTVFPILLVSGWFPVRNAVDALTIFGYFVMTGVVILAVIGLGFWTVGRVRGATAA